MGQPLGKTMTSVAIRIHKMVRGLIPNDLSHPVSLPCRTRRQDTEQEYEVVAVCAIRWMAIIQLHRRTSTRSVMLTHANRGFGLAPRVAPRPVDPP